MGLDNFKKNSSADLMSYVQSREWGNFNNRGMFFLVRSLQIRGVKKMQNKMNAKMYFEDIHIFKTDKKQLKTSTFESFFSDDDVEFFLKNPKTVIGFIEECNVLLRDTKLKIDRAQILMRDNEIEKLIVLVKKILNNFSIIGHWKYYITAISLRVFTEKNKSRDFGDVIKKFNEWKNNEEYYNFEGNTLIEIAHFMAKRRGVKVRGLDIVKYLHIDEFADFLADKISNEKIAELIKGRKVNGYVHLSLVPRGFDDLTLEGQHQEARNIKKYVDCIFAKSFEDLCSKEILKGSCATKDNKKIVGECVVFLGQAKNMAKFNFENKILITKMTTPEFIPYIKNVKAIITDTGGITSHAAIIAREFRLPCIVGTINATKFFKTGDKAEVDMKDGIIKKLS